MKKIPAFVRLKHMAKKTVYDLLYSDSDILVVSKPAGLLSMQDRFREAIPHLFGMLSEEFGKVFVVHRLDRETSGVMVFARNAEANQDLCRRFEHREVEKTYMALVKGILTEKEGLIDAPIGDDQRQQGAMRIDEKHGKPAQTAYKVLDEFGSLSLVELKPQTGRQHQIRVHLRHLGHPLAIDALYGTATEIKLSNIKPGYKGKRDGEERPLMSRLTLHASHIRFCHLRNGQLMEFSAPLPDDFTLLLKQLKRWK